MNKQTKILLTTVVLAGALVIGNAIAKSSSTETNETVATEHANSNTSTVATGSSDATTSATSQNRKTAKPRNREVKAEDCTVGSFDYTPKSKKDGIRLKRTAYTLLYDKDTKLPIWVAWQLAGNHVDGPYGRSGLKFADDMDVPAPRATNMDYVQSGYDRGHMCPSGDNKWSEAAQTESFLYTNCCPQLHNLNAGDWNELEGKCRTWAKKYGSVYIVCGPLLLNKQHKTIGKNKVVVPEAFYKVVLCMQGKPKGIGFIYRNEVGNRKMSSYVNTIDDVERITGIDFFPNLPDDIENEVEAKADLNDW